ncbi:MAG: AbgT family transporter, partial [Oscillospiraceae bacterium]
MENITTKEKRPSLFNRFLNRVEKAGNKLPHPIALFAMFAVGIVVISGILSAIGFSEVGDLVNRATGTIERQTVNVVSLFNLKGIAYMLTKAVSNFTGFAPLGTVLVAMLGVGVAESSGWISALLRKTVKITPVKLITPVVVFLGVMSNVAGDAGYVVLIPIGALMFMAYGRHPLAGLAAAFAGVSGGFSANMLIGTLDPLLCGITNEAIKIIDPNYAIQPTSNWYFMMASTVLITILGTFITDKIVEPRLGH